jgi:hypothetical protein
MTTAKRIKDILISYIADNRPSDDISVIDANQRTLATLPAIAVAVPSVEAHSEALFNVERASVELTLRIHAGDDDDSVDLDSWTDQIESLLNDPSAIVALSDAATLKIFHWTYNGATQDFSDAALDTVFRAECLCTRLPPPTEWEA